MIDGSRYDPLSFTWVYYVHMVVRSVRRERNAEYLRHCLEHQKFSLPYLGDPDDITKCLNTIQELCLELSKLYAPWIKPEDEEKLGERLKSLWEEQFGDMSSEEVQAKIQAQADELYQRQNNPNRGVL